MSMPRSFFAALAVCFVAGFLSMLGLQRADAATGDCVQSWSRVLYSYDDPSNVPDGVEFNGASDADVTSGPLAEQPGCESFQSGLDVRLSTMQDTHVTTTLQFVYGPLDPASAPSTCKGVVQQPASSNGVVYTDVLAQSQNTDGTVSMVGTVTLGSSFADPLVGHLGEQVSYPATLRCDGAVVSQTSFIVTPYGEPAPTQVSLSRTTSKVAASTVSGRLVKGRKGHRHPVSGARVVVQHKTASGWSRVAKVHTDHFGRYSLTLHDSHALRAKYPASLRLRGSVSKAR